ncbi:uncharacterized protein [Amphiura filiformis]|uniref:uncharacterized protein n=1 Tax=Amphiura filiformis TaxID=82378 RepID=UPI003B2199B6
MGACGYTETTINFEFKQFYVNISNEIAEFQTTLVTDLTNTFQFPSGSFTDVQITETSDDKIDVDMKLEIDTDDAILVTYRDNLEHSLKYERYFFTYNGTVYGVRGSSVVIVHAKTSLLDKWNQVALEILLASMAALMCFALFIFAVYCYMFPHLRKRLRQRTRYAQRNRRWEIGESNGHVNNGMEMQGNRHDRKYGRNNDRFDTQSLNSVATVASTRGGPKDTLFDKLTYASYSVPPTHMFNYL